MSVHRFYFVDLDFFHKNTSERLIDKLGPYGALVWLSLCAEAKRSRVKGTVIVASEPDFWQQLGLYGRDVGFDMETFLRLTGQLKQTRIRRVGHLKHIEITAYGRWQNDGNTQLERERKSSKRHENTRDIDRTRPGQGPDKTRTDRDREIDKEQGPSLSLVKQETLEERAVAAKAALEQMNNSLKGIA